MYAFRHRTVRSFRIYVLGGVRDSYGRECPYLHRPTAAIVVPCEDGRETAPPVRNAVFRRSGIKQTIASGKHRTRQAIPHFFVPLPFAESLTFFSRQNLYPGPFRSIFIIMGSGTKADSVLRKKSKVKQIFCVNPVKSQNIFGIWKKIYLNLKTGRNWS